MLVKLHIVTFFLEGWQCKFFGWPPEQEELVYVKLNPHSAVKPPHEMQILQKRPSVSLPYTIHNALVAFLIASSAQGLEPSLNHCKRYKQQAQTS